MTGNDTKSSTHISKDKYFYVSEKSFKNVKKLYWISQQEYIHSTNIISLCIVSFLKCMS